MLSNEQLLNGLPPELTLRFFATFARFEFALKQVGCLKSSAEGDVAEASRERLSERLPPNFFATVEHSGNAATLISRPAKNLLVQANGLPQFGAQQSPLQNTRQLLDAVWRVRNNLFHGNKLYPADRQRDQALMQNVLSVIDAVINADQGISAAFHEPQLYF